MPWSAFCFYFRVIAEMIQIMSMTTTRIAITPTATPALNMPVITEQLLKVNNAIASNNKFNFFIDRYLFLGKIYPITMLSDESLLNWL